jgi:hypothetical protein
VEEALGMANGRWRGRPWRTAKSAKRKEKRREEEAKDRRRRHLGLRSWYEEEEEELLCLSIALLRAAGRKQGRMVRQ